MSIQPVFAMSQDLTMVCGSFETNGSGTIANQLGPGTIAHSATGTWTVTLDRCMGVMHAGFAVLDTNTGDQYARAPTYSNSTGVTVLTLLVIDNSGAAAADVDGPRLNWIAFFSRRALP